MRDVRITKAAGAGLALLLLLSTGAQAQIRADAASSGGVNAKAVAADERTHRLLDRVDAVLRRDGKLAQAVSLAMAPGADEGRELCGVAFLSEGRFALFHVSNVQNLETSLSLTPVAATLNGLAIAHNDVYAQCGGVGRARFIVENHSVLD